MRQVLFAHSGGPQTGSGMGSYDLVTYLRRQLGPEYPLQFPLLDDPDHPTWRRWKELLDTEFAALQHGSILIGHSLGGSVLLKYLAEVRPPVTLSGIFLVAIPFWGRAGWDAPEFALPRNAVPHLPDIPIHFYHGYEDAVVPFEHVLIYKRMLPEAVLHGIDGRDHAFGKGMPGLVADIKAVDAGIML